MEVHIHMRRLREILGQSVAKSEVVLESVGVDFFLSPIRDGLHAVFAAVAWPDVQCDRRWVGILLKVDFIKLSFQCRLAKG